MTQTPTDLSHSPVILVHGGAGPLPEEDWHAAMEGVREAREAAFQCLQRGGSAEDACIAAVMVLEDHPVYDAGIGSHLDQRGKVVMDASIMRDDRSFGGVIGVETVRNPIQLARTIMHDPDLIILFGEGAEAYAKAKQIALCENSVFVVPREQSRFLRHQEEGHSGRMSEFLQEKSQPRSDTVGAVVRDSKGQFVAANSTGGTPFKIHGRVGDTPLPGCGLVAEAGKGAVACTGWGEAITRLLLAQRTLLSMHDRLTQDAANQAIFDLYKQTGGEGGVLCIREDGDIGVAFNTTHMPWAGLTAQGQRLDTMNHDVSVRERCMQPPKK